MLSLFGLVLAIGIVVDDAIVVVENVERNLEHGHSPKGAAHKSMDEVSGALVAIVLVLCAVFVPTTFLTGISGEFYRQFAVTIATATVISLVLSLTLSPALAAMLLRPRATDTRRRAGGAWRLSAARGLTGVSTGWVSGMAASLTASRRRRARRWLPMPRSLSLLPRCSGRRRGASFRRRIRATHSPPSSCRRAARSSGPTPCSKRQ